MEITEETIDAIVEDYKANRHIFESFLTGVDAVFKKHPKLNTPPFPILHSTRSRTKDPDHLREKIIRKYKTSGISVSNYSRYITDIGGLRVLHLYQDQFPLIHKVIQETIARKDWVLDEQPKAYTWDPESTVFFQSFDLNLEVKDSLYTSVHYVVRPRSDAFVCCEIQVRTLLEETWGEVDHSINYPVPTAIMTCKEQLRVLARIIGAGSRLTDSIFRSHKSL